MKNVFSSILVSLFLTLMGCHQVVNAQSDSSKTSFSSGSYSLMSINSPSENNLSLRINAGGGKNLKYVKIFDIIGKEVASMEVGGQSFPLQYNFDLSNHRQNIFICNLYSDKGLIESKKFFKGKIY